MSTSPTPASTARGFLRSSSDAVRRRIYLGVGLLSVALAAVGAVVPGLPTTIFLIVASYCFARSHPPLEGKLVRCPLFRPYLPYLDGTRPITRGMRLRISLIIAVAVAASVVLQTRAGVMAMVPVATGLAGAVGVVVVWRWRRGLLPGGPASVPERRGTSPEGGGVPPSCPGRPTE
jgi:hypothetical protein